ncbi:MAG: hypothetical protein UY73_C0007G0002 [Parcubacteria group bacterium GW2011_GWA2_52_8]|nr:MAG: hypothetical protein UY73_C0007G0002 [Parcubacteria group bacterium GW2011_GWA2_52_8]
MQSIPLVELAWELFNTGMKPDDIALKVEKDRATVYRWISGIKLKGIRKFLNDYEQAKKGRRQKRKTNPVTKARIYEIRKRYHDCCGEKIAYWLMHDYGIKISISTIYNILGEKYQLRSKWKKNQKRGPVPKAQKPREILQHDTVDFGQIFAFTAVDIFTREAQVVIGPSLLVKDGSKALHQQMRYFQSVELMQKDGGPEFGKEWEEAAKLYCRRVRTSRPYRKNEQAYIESFNRTLRKECLGWRNYRKSDLLWVQAKVDEFLEFYNHRRPHLSLNLLAPKTYLSHLRV